MKFTVHPYRAISLTLVSVLCISGAVFGYVASTDAPLWERTELVFVYGTLTNPAVRFAVCRCHTPLVPATLPEYRKEGLTIIPDTHSVVSGGVIAVSPTELARLDRYERTPTRYRREEITIANQTMWVYIKN